MKSHLRLGTRKSLLAWAQSSWVALEIEKHNPGVKVELYGIETRGDKIQDIPLQNIEGKEFFVAELDEALRSGKVDLTVHSMKDLSLDRPEAFVCAAIPKRANPRDVILFGPHALARLKSGAPLQIGTSSPRRIENIPSFLKRALPRLNPSKEAYPSLEFVEIRGNVNTRLGRVQEPPDSPRYLDGVVLAMAGLIRLWNDEAGQNELTRLLDGVKWMVLPLKDCPAAPAQGALSIECRSNDLEVREMLAKLHHPQTERDAHTERELLAKWGGGCHQRFGATAIESNGLGNLLFIKGAKSDGEKVDELRWHPPIQENSAAQEVRAWDGSQWKPKPTRLLTRLPDFSKRAVFVAHSRAIEKADSFESARIWTSGTSSWFKLAEQGLWVEGCAEGLGFDSLISSIQEKVLNLPPLSKWTVLTHEAAQNEWNDKGIPVIPTYKINFNYLEEVKSSLKMATHVFWSSGSQFDELKEWASKDAQHACGPGKTAARLKKQGITPKIFPSGEEWKRWLQTIK